MIPDSIIFAGLAYSIVCLVNSIGLYTLTKADTK